MSMQRQRIDPSEVIMRAMICQMLAHVTGRDPLLICQERYADDEETPTFIRANRPRSTSP